MNNENLTKVVWIRGSIMDYIDNPSYVYIGRSSKWNNPFAIKYSTASKVEAVALYREYFTEQIKDESFLEALTNLRGKTLACHCRPRACHGDVIAEYLNTTS